MYLYKEIKNVIKPIPFFEKFKRVLFTQFKIHGNLSDYTAFYPFNFNYFFFQALNVHNLVNSQSSLYDTYNVYMLFIYGLYGRSLPKNSTKRNILKFSGKL